MVYNLVGHHDVTVAILLARSHSDFLLFVACAKALVIVCLNHTLSALLKMFELFSIKSVFH